jgi:hypothetical protein
VAEDGTLSGAVGLLYVRAQLESFTLQDEFRWWQPAERAGRVAAAGSEDRAAPWLSGTALRLTVGPGPWRVAMGSPYIQLDIAGFHAIGFWAKADAAGADDFRVQLRDRPTYIVPTVSAAVPIVQGRLIEGGALATTYRRVVVPLRRLLGDAPGFQTRLLGYVILSGEARRQTTYWIDDMRFFPTQEELDRYARPAQP